MNELQGNSDRTWKLYLQALLGSCNLNMVNLNQKLDTVISTVVTSSVNKVVVTSNRYKYCN